MPHLVVLVAVAFLRAVVKAGLLFQQPIRRVWLARQILVAAHLAQHPFLARRLARRAALAL
jgi:hypothetical protein